MSTKPAPKALTRAEREAEKKRLNTLIDEKYDEIDDLEKKRKALGNEKEIVNVCPRCEFRQEAEPEHDALCCVQCGYCDLVAEGTPKLCSYHGERGRP